MKFLKRDFVIAGPRVTNVSKNGTKTKEQKLYYVEGEFLTLNQIAEKYNMSYFTIRHRLETQGLDPERAIQKVSVNGRKHMVNYNG